MIKKIHPNWRGLMGRMECDSQGGLAIPLPLDTREGSNFSMTESQSNFAPFQPLPCAYSLRCNQLNLKCKEPCMVKAYYDRLQKQGN